MNLDDLTRDLFRMPDDEPDGADDSCPSCDWGPVAPHVWHRPDARTLVCGYACPGCREQWECSWWEGGN